MSSLPTPAGSSGSPRPSFGVRQANLSQVLALVHRNGTLRRSEITSMTGLNRSTVLDLVQELQTKSLVTQERISGVGEIGRPSIEVRGSNSIVSFVVIPRLRELTIGVVGLGGHVIERKRYTLPTGATPGATATKAGELINALRRNLPEGTRIAGVGVAAPGQVRVQTRDLRFAPSLGWRETPFAEMLQQHTNLTVRLDNDASLACAAELTFGAGRGHEHMVFLIGVSGGIGGGAVVNGELLRGNLGYAGELGHMRISDSPTDDYSGLPGTLEALVRRDDLLDVVGLTDADDDQLREALTAKATERPVHAVLTQQTHYLARGIANLLIALNPEVVVLSGFLEILLELHKEQLLADIQKQSLPFALEGVEIRPGSLGSNLLLIGTAELSFQALLSDPLGYELVTA
jgi:predicted NBD/HSP70 family sugar kinase